MGHLIHRPDGRFLWVAFTDEGGKLQRRRTPYTAAQEGEARRFLADLEDKVAASKRAGVTEGQLLVRQHAKGWLERREKLGIVSVNDNRIHLERHVLPTLGHLPIDQVRARQLVDLFAGIRLKRVGPEGEQRTLSPKTVWNIYGTVKAMFRDAKLDGLVHEDPAILGEHQLGRQVDRDTLEAADSIYPREDIRQILTDEHVPLDRRVFYALEYFGRCRLGEAAACCWVHYQPTWKPLGQLVIARSHGRDTTKSGRSRYMPVHPELAIVLDEWRATWPGIYGREPLPTDLIVPMVRVPGAGGRRLATGARRTRSIVNKAFEADLRALALPHRRGHDLGASLITHAEEDGADAARLARCTHTGGRKTLGAFEHYLRRNWSSSCAEVAKLRISLRPAGAEVIPLARYRTVSGHSRSGTASPRESSGTDPEGDPQRL